MQCDYSDEFFDRCTLAERASGVAVVATIFAGHGPSIVINGQSFVNGLYHFRFAGAE